MKKSILAFTIFFFSLSCDVKTDTTTVKLDSLKTETKVDTFAVIKNSIKKSEDTTIEFPASLRPFLSKTEIEKFAQAREYYFQITSSKELAHFYSVLLPELYEYINNGILKSHPEVEMSGDNAPVATWKVIKKYLPMIEVEVLCSECSTQPITNVQVMLAMAKKTPEKEDDYYFNFLMEIYGNKDMPEEIVYDGGGNNGNWFSMVTCVCGYTNLGNGAILKFCKTSDKCFTAGSSFKKEIEQKRGLFFPSSYEKVFWGKEEEVTRELNAILKEVMLNEEETKAINQLKEKLKTDKEIQFDCQAGECKIDC